MTATRHNGEDEEVLKLDGTSEETQEDNGSKKQAAGETVYILARSLGVKIGFAFCQSHTMKSLRSTTALVRAKSTFRSHLPTQ